MKDSNACLTDSTACALAAAMKIKPVIMKSEHQILTTSDLD